MPTSQSHRVASGIGRASALLASGTIVSRILGFVKVIVFAQVIGQFGQGANAFALANQLPNTVYVIVAGGVLTAVLVPQIVRSALHHDGGTAYINKLVTIALVVLGATTLVATLLARPLTMLIAGNIDPAQLELADGLGVLVPAADLLLRALHGARRGAQCAPFLRPVHVGSRPQQRRRHRAAS